MNRVDELYVGWQDQSSRRWYPIGRLTADGDRYVFEYLRGASRARDEANFRGISQFPDFDRTYRSVELFPFFQNRVKSSKRADSDDEIRRLGLSEPDTELRAFDILSRTYGQRMTDRFQIYPPPSVDGREVTLTFFTRGIRHRNEKTRSRWQSGTAPVEPIRFSPDPDNDYDPNALYVVDAEGWDMGYLPWFYTESFSQLVDAEVPYEIQVRRQNLEPSYPQHRFLLEFRGERPPGWQFPQSPLYDSFSTVVEPERTTRGVA